VTEAAGFARHGRSAQAQSILDRSGRVSYGRDPFMADQTAQAPAPPGQGPDPEDRELVARAQRGDGAAFGADITDDRAGLSHSIFPAQQDHHYSPCPAAFGIGGKILEDIMVNQFLNSPILRIICGYRRFGILLNQFWARRDQPIPG